MNEITKSGGKSRGLIRWLFAAAFIFAVIYSGLLSGLMNTAGLFFLIVASVAVSLLGFSRREIGAAFRHAAGFDGTWGNLKHSAYFWEAAARNAWILGVLGSALNFTIALSTESGGLTEISGRMIQSFIVILYGLVLAVICLVPAMKLAGRAEKSQDTGIMGAGRIQPLVFERVTGGVLFAAVLGLAIAFLVKGYPQNGPLPIAKVMLHGPAILVVFGGAIALALFTGVGAGARALTLGFGMTGLIGLLTGLIQALFGFVHTSINEIAAAVAFIISTSLFALLGLAVIAAPLEDREVMEGRREGPGPYSRLLWTVFPLLAFIFLLLTFVMVITPMKKPG